MLWQKSWWETRLMFFASLGAMIGMTTVTLHPWSPINLANWFEAMQRRALISGQDFQSITSLLNNHYGYVWVVFFRLLLLLVWPLFTLLIGISLYPSSIPHTYGAFGASGRYTHALPVSRRKVLLTHTALMAMEMTVVALFAAIIIAFTLQMMGVWIPLHKILIHALLLPLGGMAFLTLTILLAVILENMLTPFAIGGSVLSIFVISVFPHQRTMDEYPRWSIFHLMSGDAYFRYGQIPWLELLTWLAIAAAILLLAVRIYERRDF